ncbi:MAG: hypothetical protein ACI4J6_07300 [Oscillospiraceae bacterium]
MKMKINTGHIIILAAVIIAIIIVVFIFAPLISMITDYAGEVSKSNAAVKAAQNGVDCYYYEKYGEHPEITGINSGLEWSGYIIPVTRYFSGYVILEEKNSTIYYKAGTKQFYDSRQYDEICSALTEKYFADKRLGTDVSADIELVYSDYWLYRNNKAAKCIDVYFDGDIDSFLKNVSYDSLSADIYYTGYGETGRAYRELISAKLEELRSLFPSGSFSVNIKYPENKITYPKHFWGTKPYSGLPADYGTLIAKGVSRKNRPDELYYTEWCEIDEFVSMADVSSELPPDKADLLFQTDSSYDGMTVFTDSNKKDTYTLTGEAYRFSCKNSRHIYIRLDRRKYSIDGNNVPIMVEQDQNGNIYPYFIGIKSIGEPYLQLMPDSWYLYDENYIYIYAYKDEAVIMFTELPS